MSVEPSTSPRTYDAARPSGRRGKAIFTAVTLLVAALAALYALSRIVVLGNFVEI